MVTLFLGAIGLALLAYFRVHPEMLPSGQTIASGADQLFPRFIVLGLPRGIGGLVVAALLAAAMSSLSSGLNSSSSVISVDLLERFRPTKRSESGHVRLNRRISIVVGIIVVALSLYVSTVQGNLLEVAYKVSNLFVAPLFFLFFMAMFVPLGDPLRNAGRGGRQHFRGGGHRPFPSPGSGLPLDHARIAGCRDRYGRHRQPDPHRRGATHLSSALP